MEGFGLPALLLAPVLDWAQPRRGSHCLCQRASNVN